MLTRAKLKRVRELAKEVAALTVEVEIEADETRHWDVETKSHVPSKNWAEHGGTALTGTLKRRSMDLSRALVELRKP